MEPALELLDHLLHPSRQCSVPQGEYDSYAEGCVSDKMMKSEVTRFGKKPHIKLNDSIWNLVVYPALNKEYDNYLCMDDNGMSGFMRDLDHSDCGILHGSTGIYTAWSILMAYENMPKSQVKKFNPNNKDSGWSTGYTVNSLFIEELIKNTKLARIENAA